MDTRVLVVDDEKLIVKGIKFSLVQDGMIVDTAHDGEEAFNLFNQNKYDIVILDIMLPKKMVMKFVNLLEKFLMCQLLCLLLKIVIWIKF